MFPYHHIPCDVVYRERVSKDFKTYSTITTFTVFMKTETRFKVPTTIIQQAPWVDDVSDVETVVVSDDDEEPSMINTLTTPAPEPTNRHVQINSLPEVRALKSALRCPRNVSRSPSPVTTNTVTSPASQPSCTATVSQRTEETVCSLELPSYDESEARSLEQPSQGEEPWLPMPDLTMYKDPAEAERVATPSCNPLNEPMDVFAEKQGIYQPQEDAYRRKQSTRLVQTLSPRSTFPVRCGNHGSYDIDGTITVINTSDMDIDGAAAATTATTTETVEEEEEEEDWEEIYGKASEWANSQPLQDEVEEADVPTQPVSEEDDELSVPNATATVAIDATQYTTCTPFQSLESGFGNDPRYNPSLRMRSKSVHIFESSTHQPLQPPKIYADAQECADAYQTTVQAVLRSCLEKVNIGKGHYAQFFDTDHTHEIWKEHPDFPGYFFSSRGAVLGKVRKFWRSVQRKVTER
ncbi:hypothetical protein BC832DRAFT_596168 [Gaertneriomyces semiglobifer]|nr:hypothetical protein BC832DRAFT_596168 [Gaertneriomyces semiglobifer]